MCAFASAIPKQMAAASTPEWANGMYLSNTLENIK
jgi:hypothetical protein